MTPRMQSEQHKPLERQKATADARRRVWSRVISAISLSAGNPVGDSTTNTHQRRGPRGFEPRPTGLGRDHCSVTGMLAGNCPASWAGALAASRVAPPPLSCAIGPGSSNEW